MTDLSTEDSNGRISVPRRDGRNERGQRTRAAIVAACRDFMQAGQFRPSMQACCTKANRSIRIGFQAFKTIEMLHLEAADDLPTREAMVERVLGDDRSVLPAERLALIARALVTGAT